jgi:hypothetical protein
MKSPSTIIWLALAVTLAALIWLQGRFFSRPDEAGGRLLPGLHAAELTEIHITPAGAKEFTAVFTNNAWCLKKPLVYPAQAAAITALLGALEKLTVATRITAAELNAKKDSEAGFGFNAPQAAVDLAAGETKWHFLVGSNTAPGDQVFIRIVGADGALVTDAAWLPLLPKTVENWRDTSLVSAADACDWIVITNGARVIELRRNPTNQLWRMLQPIATRADSARITTALQQLATAQTTRIITDDPKSDLTAFGLEPANTDVWLGRGTNLLSAIHAGKTSTEDTNQIYVRRDNFNTVALAARDALVVWSGEVNDFRDRHLLELNGPVAEIEVRGSLTNFSLVYQGTNGWRVAGETFPAETESVLNLARLVLNWRATEFVRDFFTRTDLEKYGLANPARQITFYGKADGTNLVVAQLLFGNEDAGRVFVKRADEDYIYALALPDFNRLPENGFEFRRHRLWSFSETNVAAVTMRQAGQTRTLLRAGTNSWSVAPGSQGLINPLAVEETVRRLGELEADGWVARHLTAPESFGFSANGPQLTIELKTSEKLVLDFGGTVPQQEKVFAAATLDGERWAFVFPTALTQLVAAYLAIPQETSK